MVSSARTVSSIGVAGSKPWIWYRSTWSSCSRFRLACSAGDDVAARRAAHVRARAGLAEDLGRDDDALARHLQVLQRLADDLFGAAVGVDVGGVDEVDAGIERAADDALGFVLLQAGRS